MDFVSFTDRKRAAVEGGFLGGVPVFDLAVVQYAPLVSLSNNMKLG
jgi:hypothetical protein